MSRQVRYRVAAFVLGSLIFGAPMLASGTAGADPVPPGGRQVTFSGNGFDLDCDSRRGAAPGALEPACAIGDEAEPFLVTASPSGPATTLPGPATTLSGPATALSGSATTLPDPATTLSDPVPTSASASVAEAPVSLAPPRSGDAAGTPTGSSALAAAEPPSPRKPAASRPETPRQPISPAASTAKVATAAARSRPLVRVAPRAKVKTKIKATTTAGTTGSAAPAFAGMPPGEARVRPHGVPGLDLDRVTVDAQPAAPAPPPSEIAAAASVAGAGSMREGSPSGLLALIAGVCVAGVTVAAIRSIVSERANRVKIA